MNEKDSLAILGLLLSSQCGMIFTYEGTGEEFDFKNHSWNILNYLKKIKLSYEFVRDILTDEYGSSFYHIGFGEANIRIPKHYNKEELERSDFDYIEIDKNGRIGIWCEVDGFIAWLDEYKKIWIVDSRKEVAERERKAQEKFDKIFKPLIQKTIDKIMSQSEITNSPIEWIEWNNKNQGVIKVVPFEVNGLPEYKKKGKDK